MSAPPFRYYLPPSRDIWQGRTDGPKALHFHEVVRFLDLNHTLPQIRQDQKAFALLGFACDAGVQRNHGRIGARQGPIALRQALAGLAFPWHTAICYDVGDIICIDDLLEQAQSELAKAVNLLHEHHIMPILLGGGHEIAWGHLQGILACYPESRLGIVNLDAHFDLRPTLEEGKGSSGSSFMQMASLYRQQNKSLDYTCLGIQPSTNTSALFQEAKSLNVSFLTAQEIHSQENASALKLLNETISRNDIIYVTLCLDCLASAFAPGVSAPQPLGLTPAQVVPLLEHLAASKKVVGFDIAELAPCYDNDNLTARLAAMLLYHYLAGWLCSNG